MNLLNENKQKNKQVYICYLLHMSFTPIASVPLEPLETDYDWTLENHSAISAGQVFENRQN